MHVRFDKIDGFIRIYDGTRYLVLFGPEKYDAIYNSIRYLVKAVSHITYLKAVSHMFLLSIMQKSKLILMILCL